METNPGKSLLATPLCKFTNTHVARPSKEFADGLPEKVFPQRVPRGTSRSRHQQLRSAQRGRARSSPRRSPLRRLRTHRRRAPFVRLGSRPARRFPPRYLSRRRQSKHDVPVLMAAGLARAAVRDLHGTDRSAGRRGRRRPRNQPRLPVDTATPTCTANTSTCRSCRAPSGTSKTCW